MIGIQVLTLLLAAGAAAAARISVNFGYFQEAAAHLWTYGVDSHSWTDPVSGDEFVFSFWPQTSGGRVFEKVSVGDLDFAVLGSAPWGISSTRSLPAKLVYNIKSVDRGEVFACRSDIVEPRDLKGKRVAYVPGSTVHYMMDALLSFTSLSWSDFEWVGGLNPGDQRAAWDAGEIDCGFVWMPVLGHLQSAPWCSSPDASPSSPWRSKLGVPSRDCAAGPEGVPGHNFFTAGSAKTWGKGVWNGLVVSDAFAAAYPRTVERSLKMLTAMDSKYAEDKGFFLQSEQRLCMVCVALGWNCDAANYARVRSDMGLDSVQTFEEQRSPSFLGQQAPGQCALDSIPLPANATASCTKLTAAGSTLSMQASAEFNYGLKNLPYLPSLKHYQDHVDSHYMDLIGTAGESFPAVTAADLATTFTSPLQAGVDAATNFCQDSAQPILLTAPGTFRDHDGSGFYSEAGTCTWQIQETGPILLSDILVRTEIHHDRLAIYGGLCTLAAGDCDGPAAPLLAVFSGGKGRDQGVASRPPVLAPGGRVTVVFAPDGVVDRPLRGVLADGVSLTWSRVAAGSCPLNCQNGGQCVEGQCRCTGGWAGADCSHAACLGTAELVAGATPGSIVHGPAPGTSHGADCRWTLSAATLGDVVVIEFVSLDVEAHQDPLSLFDGDGLEASLLGTYGGFLPASLGVPVGEVCPGSLCPQTVASSGSSLTLRWTSDFVQGGRGFELRYFSVSAAAAACGHGATAGCSGRGECTPQGCRCEDGAFGAFCQFRHCQPGVIAESNVSGVLRNMAVGELGYSPLRNCAWNVVPPVSETTGEAPGAIAFFVESFDLEPDFRSSDRLMIGTVSLTGQAPPCSEAAVCSATRDCGAGTCTGGHCVCRPIVMPATSATVSFHTDLNDFPAGSRHQGFVLRYTAVYDCPRNATTGLCLALDECATQRTVPGWVSCERCPAGSIFKMVGERPTCESCAPGFFHDVAAQACSICPAGHFTDTAGQTACSECSPGHGCPVGAARMQPCEPGYFAASAALEQCLPCVSGSFAETAAATGCQLCGAGKEKPEAWTTAALVQTAGGSEYSKIMGAVNRSACECEEGFRRDLRGECEPCGEGVVCKLHSVQLEPGYVGEQLADGTLSVFRCRDSQRCPGGDLGTCAQGRTGIACAVCEEGTTPTDSPPGTCIPCSGTDYTPFIAVVAGLILGLLVLYIVLDRQTRAVQSHALLICSFSLVQFATLMQQLSAVSTIPVAMPDPIRSLFTFARVFMFDIKILKLSCMASVAPVTEFAMRACMALFCFVVIMLIHLVYVAVVHKGDYKGRRYVAICTVGSVFTIFLTQMLLTLAGPLQCTQHPNGEWTALDYETTLCWNSKEHANMLIVALLVAPVPLAYMVKCVHTICRFPEAVQRGDFDFVQRYQFLFTRFTSDCYYFSLVPLFGNLTIALATIIPNISVQIIVMQVVLLTSLLLCLRVRPWRVALSNKLDAVLTSATLLAVSLCPFFARMSEDALLGLTWLVGLILVAVALAVPVLIVYGLIRMLALKSKPCSYFLSYHKAGAGVFARLLRQCLLEDGRAKGMICLGGDAMGQLECVFNTVAHETQSLVVIASKEVFLQPHCVGHMTIAKLKAVNTQVVQMPDFQLPSAELLQSYDTHVDVQCLTANGMDLPMIRDTVQWAVALPRIILSQVGSGHITVLVDHLGGKEALRASVRPEVPGGARPRGVVADASNGEALAAALILQRLLSTRVPEDAPVLLDSDYGDDAALDRVKCRLVICTNGCLSQASFQKLLLSSSGGCDLELVPVVCESSFRYPTAEAAARDLAGEDSVAKVVAEMFKEIPLTFLAQRDSDEMLETEASCIAHRLLEEDRFVKNARRLKSMTRPSGLFSPSRSRQSSNDSGSSPTKKSVSGSFASFRDSEPRVSGSRSEREPLETL